MKFLSVIVIFISMINFGYAFETIEKSMDLFELEIVDFEEIENLEKVRKNKAPFFSTLHDSF